MSAARRGRPRRRIGWAWVVFAIGIVVNGLRLRARLARIPVLGQGADRAPGEPRSLAIITAAGVEVDDEIRRLVAAHAASEGLDVVDLVPGDLMVEQALDLARLVDTAAYRTTAMALGRGALHAIAVTPEVLERADLPRTAGLDIVEMAEASLKLKQCAPRTTDLVIAPGLRCVPADPEHRRPYLRVLAGRLASSVTYAPVAEAALVVAGVILEPGWGLASLALWAFQPWLATAAVPIAPRDLGPGGAAQRWWRLPVDAVRAGRSSWVPAVEAAGDPRAVERARPVYEALLADGTDRFFEARRSTCPRCGTGDLAVRVASGDLLQHKPGRFVLEQCRGCGHIFQNPRLSLEGLDFYYRDFYDGLAADEADTVFAATDTAYRARARLVAEVVTPTRWLDVGGGHGHFCLIAAEELPETRFDVLDQGESVEQAVRRGWVTEGHRGLFPDLAPRLAGAYDMISMHHYLEHTRDPWLELDAARVALAPGGHLLIELPDPACGFGRLMGPFWGPWFQPQHQHFLSLESLCEALGERGFTVLDRVTGNAHQPADFSFGLWSFAQWLAPPPAAPWLPPRSRAQRAGRAAVFTALGPVFVVTLVADWALAPLIRRVPGGSNAYRVLARLDR